MFNYTKMNGNGNSFLIFDIRGLNMSFQEKVNLSKKECDINTSIGADGFIFVSDSEDVDFKMEIFNADGSEAEMCGNGARCVSKFAYDNNIAPREMSFETKAGIMKAFVDDEFVDLLLGSYEYLSDKNETVINLFGDDLNLYSLNVGVPHCVIFLDDLDFNDTKKINNVGKKICEMYSLFPEGTNVNFVKLEDSKNLKVITYERGVNDFTASCGTGSCASAIVASSIKSMGKEINIINPGGINKVKLESSGVEGSYKVTLSSCVNNVASIQMIN